MQGRVGMVRTFATLLSSFLPKATWEWLTALLFVYSVSITTAIILENVYFYQNAIV